MMKKQEKIEYLKANHPVEWRVTRDRAEQIVSNSQSIKCVCGKLATGLHESSCSRFKSKVETETCRILIYLLPKKSE